MTVSNTLPLAFMAALGFITGMMFYRNPFLAVIIFAAILTALAVSLQLMLNSNRGLRTDP